MTQGNFFTGTTAGGDTLEVTDGTTTNTDVRKIIVSAGTITASSGHTVTVTTGGGGGGGIGGTIAVTQVAYGSGADTIKGEAAFTYTEGTDTLSVGVVATTGTGVSVGGTGTITTNNGSISAGGATGSVSANTTVTAGTIVQAPTITSDEKLIVSRGNTFGAGVFSVANEDLTTLGFGANLPSSVIIKGGVGTTLICDNIALGAIDDGTRFTVTATEAPVSVAFETPIAGGAIGAYDLPNVGDAVTVQKCVAAAGWIIISTAGTAVKA